MTSFIVIWLVFSAGIAFVLPLLSSAPRWVTAAVALSWPIMLLGAIVLWIWVAVEIGFRR